MSKIPSQLKTPKGLKKLRHFYAQQSAINADTTLLAQLQADIREIEECVAQVENRLMGSLPVVER